MLLKEDFKTHVYEELIHAIERDNENSPKLDEAISTAEDQAKGYLSRYDIDALFAKEGADRPSMLLTFLKDLAMWHFIVIANPNIDTAFAEERYKDAIRELGKIQAGKLVPHNWPVPDDTDTSGSLFHFRSKPRRETSY